MQIDFVGIVMGKAEGHGDNWHGHVTALTVSPDYRRLGLAATLMHFLENVSEKWVISVKGFFIIFITAFWYVNCFNGFIICFFFHVYLTILYLILIDFEHQFFFEESLMTFLNFYSNV